MGKESFLLSARGVLVVACLAATSACTMIVAEEHSEPLIPAAASTLENSDQSLADEKLQTALEKSLSGEATRWQNPLSGVKGSVTPLKTWKTAEGTYCRSYSEKIILASGKSLNREGIACRSQNAVWESAA